MPGKTKAELLREIEVLRARFAQFEREAAERGPGGEASEALLRVARELAGTLDVTQATEQVVGAVLRLFHARCAALFRLDRDSGSLVCVAAAGEGDPGQWVGRSLPAGAGSAGLAVAEGRPISSLDLLADPRITLPEWMPEVLRVKGCRSAMAAPLLARGETLGSLDVCDAPGRAFTEDDLRLLSVFADQAALALGNARLYEEAGRRRREAEVVAELARTINASLDLDTVLQRVTEGAREICGSDAALIALREPGSDAMLFRYRVGAAGYEGWADLRIEAGKGAGGQVLLTGHPFRTDHYAWDPRIGKEYLEAIREAGVVALMVVPIRIGERVEGLLYVENRSPRPFTDRDEAILVRLADHAAIAVRNVQLFSGEQAARARAETSERRFRDLVQSLDAVVWEAWVAGRPAEGEPEAQEGPRRFSFVSRQAETMLGYPVERWLAEPNFWVNLIHPRDRERVMAASRSAAASEGDLDLEYRVVTAWDRVIWLRDIAHPIRDVGGRALRLRGVMVDVTELKRAEERKVLQFAVTSLLAESVTLQEAVQKLLQAVCEDLGWDVGEMWLLDREAGVLRWNGIWHDPLVDASEFEAVSREMTFSLGMGLPGRTWAGGKPEWIPNVREDPDFLRGALAAREGLYAAFAFPIRTDGEVTGVMVFFSRDVRPPDYDVLKMVADIGAQIGQFAGRKKMEEALRQSEEQLRQAQKMEALGRLAGGVAHDFGNLLAVITIYGDLLLANLPEGVPLREHAEAIGKAAEQAAALTRQLLAFGRKQILRARVLDLNAIVANTATMLRRLIGETIELVIVPGTDLGPVRADPGQLQQVVVNLAVNARDAMPQGGRLTIATANADVDEAFVRAHAGARPGSYVTLEVQDTGSGMDATTRAHMFEPFFTTKEGGQGTGLGLSTVYGIVRQHQGYIQVESEPGQGSVFRVFLPRTGGPAEPLEAARILTGLPRGSETILLAEDEAEVRDVVRQVLSERGYRVLEAADGAKALLVAERHAGPIHLLLTDVVMPRLSGPELARQLTRIRPDVKVVYMSGHADEALSPHGVLEVLQKPFTSEALTHKVRDVLDARPDEPGP